MIVWKCFLSLVCKKGRNHIRCHNARYSMITIPLQPLPATTERDSAELYIVLDLPELFLLLFLLFLLSSVLLVGLLVL